jgi:hypothetical protein
MTKVAQICEIWQDVVFRQLRKRYYLARS